MKTAITLTLISPRMPRLIRTGSSIKNSASAAAIPPYLGTYQEPKIQGLTKRHKRFVKNLLELRGKTFTKFYDSSDRYPEEQGNNGQRKRKTTQKPKHKGFIGCLYDALHSYNTHISQGHNSLYYIDEIPPTPTTKGEIIALRISDHNANAKNFAKDHSDRGYSVVGKEGDNKSGQLFDSDFREVMEFTYDDPTAKTYRNIINRIIIFFASIEYSDPGARVEQTKKWSVPTLYDYTDEEAEKAVDYIVMKMEGESKEHNPEEEKEETKTKTMKKGKKKGLSGAQPEPTDIKEMFDRLPIEGKDVRNIRYRTEDILVYADEADFMDTPRSWVILARKLKAFEAFIEKIESIVYRTYSPVYNSKEWWSCSYSDYYNLKGILYLVHIYNETCAGASRNSLRVIFESPGQCMMFTQNGVEYLYTSKAYMFKGCGGFTWDLSRGIWVDKWHHHRPLMLKAMKRDFPDGKFVDRLIDEKLGPFAELLYDSSRFSLLCNKDHNFAWHFLKEIPKSYSFSRKEDVKGIAREVCKEMGLDIDSNRFIEYTPNDINRAIAIIEKGLREKRFPRGKRYGIAADFAKAAQARARATKTAAKAKIKIARMKRK